MKSPLRLCTLLLLTALYGCNSQPAVVTKPADPVGPAIGKANSFQAVLDGFRYPENPRSSDDWNRFREGLQQLSGHFSKPDVIVRLSLPAPDREFLAKVAHVSESELSELEASTFRNADAHYLDECFLLRDAARFVEVRGLSPLEQAHFNFRWVMRNVYLDDQGDDWIPPAFVLRRGFGTALERAFVFLAILRQSNMEGCLIVVPKDEPTQFLVAVLDPKTSKLLLFDTRLGIALPGKDGKSIATLQDAIEDPKLLDPSQITKDDAKKLEAWLACPMQALSPRMLELQKGFSVYDSIVLYLNARELHGQIAKATKISVKVWNSEGPPAPLLGSPRSLTKPNSPTRCLTYFLPTQDGGLADPRSFVDYMRTRLPLDLATVNYARLNLSGELLPRAAQMRLRGITGDLLEKYEVQIRELYLRGLYEPAIRRQERLQAFARNDLLVGLADDRTFRETLTDWRKKLNDVSAFAINHPNDPKAQKIMDSFWVDPFVSWLGDVEHAEKLDREEKKSVLAGIEQKKSVLGGILAVGVRDYFNIELARYQASFNQEKAEQAQAQLQATAKPTKAAQTRTREAWILAKSAWSNFYIDHIALEDAIDQRVKLIPSVNIALKIGLLEYLNQDIHKYFEAKLRLAECLEHLEGAKAARAYRQRILAEIEALQKEDRLPREIRTVRENLDRSRQPKDGAAARQQLSRLARDWSEGGSFYWMKLELRHKIARSSSI